SEEIVMKSSPCSVDAVGENSRGAVGRASSLWCRLCGDCAHACIRIRCTAAQQPARRASGADICRCETPGDGQNVIKPMFHYTFLARIERRSGAAMRSAGAAPES